MRRVAHWHTMLVTDNRVPRDNRVPPFRHVNLHDLDNVALLRHEAVNPLKLAHFLCPPYKEVGREPHS